MTASSLPQSGVDEREIVRTARTAGLFYLGSIVAAVFGYFIIPAQIFNAADAAATVEQLVGQETLARVGIAMELASATCQALLALWFYKLFRSVDHFAAMALVVLGEFNAVLVVAAAAFLATALNVALNPSLGAAATVQSMYIVRDNLWNVATVFFGLWLLPMGLLVLRSGWMPRLMAWLLIVGGVGYVVHAFTIFLAPNATTISGVFTWPTVSEFWMAGYLLFKGVRRPRETGSRDLP